MILHGHGGARAGAGRRKRVDADDDAKADAARLAASVGDVVIDTAGLDPVGKLLAFADHPLVPVKLRIAAAAHAAKYLVAPIAAVEAKPAAAQLTAAELDWAQDLHIRPLN